MTNKVFKISIVYGDDNKASTGTHLVVPCLHSHITVLVPRGKHRQSAKETIRAFADQLAAMCAAIEKDRW